MSKDNICARCGEECGINEKSVSVCCRFPVNITGPSEPVLFKRLHKEIQDLKLAIVNNGSDLLAMQKVARGFERELATSESVHEKQVHHMAGEINRQINKVADAEKDRDSLKEQLAESDRELKEATRSWMVEQELRIKFWKWREKQRLSKEKAEKERDELKKQLATTRSNYLFQISEQDAEIERLNERVAKANDPEWNEVSRRNKEILELRERLARTVELGGPVLKLLGEAGGRQLEISRKFNDALASYDPKWIEGVRAEAREKIVDYLTLKFAENGPVGIAHDIRKLWENLEAVRQPNQSREERG